MLRILVALLVVLAAVLGGRLALGEADTERGRVTRVIDGDTIEVRVGGRLESVRLIGIDTPERGSCGFEESSDALHRRADERRVTLVGDSSQDARDRYDRLLAYVELRPGGDDLGEWLVRRGWAPVYVYDRPFARLGRYRAAARQARRERRGLHRLCGRLP